MEILLFRGLEVSALTAWKPTRTMHYPALSSFFRVMNRSAVTACGTGFLNPTHLWAVRHRLGPQVSHLPGVPHLGIKEPPGGHERQLPTLLRAMSPSFIRIVALNRSAFVALGQ